MKKIYFIISILFIGLNASAQLSLTKAFNEPVIGDIHTTQGYDSSSVLPKSLGIGQLWDFSALTTNTLVEVGTYTTVASTPSAAAFATSTIAESDGFGGYTYSKATATQYELTGIVDPNITLNFTNTAIAAIWPVSMGYSNTDTFSGSASSGTMTGSATGTINTMATGTGTLIIPGGATYTNVLQIRTKQTVKLSLLFGLVTATVVGTDYNYYHSSLKNQILAVSYSDTQGSFTDVAATVKVNNAVVTNINGINFNPTLSIFPNPTKNQFTVKVDNRSNLNCKVELYNTMGELVQANDLGNKSQILSVIQISNLSTGMYIVRTFLGKQVSNNKLIVE